ncbi:hypothetical protein [Streptomyces sp. IBSNAI001]|uniref:hypothetical protein n=1 Tax=Streptomyces sp. IBSNAI001 TaxID=3457499 RepID=UPI003FD31716
MVNPSQRSAGSTQGGASGSGGAELSWPLTTWQGWHRFATTDPPAPPQAGDPPRSTEQRLAYHAAFVTIRTPAVHALADQVRTLVILGRHQQTTARPSLIVTGCAAARGNHRPPERRAYLPPRPPPQSAATRISARSGTRRVCSGPARRDGENPRH